MLNGELHPSSAIAVIWHFEVHISYLRVMNITSYSVDSPESTR